MKCGPGHWTIDEINRLPAKEVFQHIILQRRRRGQQFQWMLSAATYEHMTEAGRKSINQVISDHLTFGMRTAAPFEMADTDQARLEMIGLVAIKSGADFSTRFKGHAAWLSQHGYTVADAIQAQRSAEAIEATNKFWRENR